MESSNRRNINELLTLYELEPSIETVYVEGKTDKIMLELFFERFNIQDVSVYEIDTIDFSKLYKNSPDLIKNHKRKIIKLSEIFADIFNEKELKINFIADKDYDYFLNKILNNKFLIYTDYTSIEMYFFDNKTIERFYKVVSRGFPVSPKLTLKNLSVLLQKLFLFRIACKIENINVQNFSVLEKRIFKKLIKINKTGAISFDFDEYINRVLSKFNIINLKKSILEKINIYEKKLTNDPRNQIHGHDFTYLLFLFIDKIKNNISLNEVLTDRTLYLCKELNELKTENLFSKLYNVYI